MPIGFANTVWSSMMNSCVRDVQNLLRRWDRHGAGRLDDPFDVHRGDFLSLMATIPFELKLRMWLPAIPV